MRATKIKIQDLSIPFLINSDNERHWPMRLICESMGLSWHAQAAKLQPPRYSPTEHDVAVQGEPLQKRMLCLSQSEFEFWLKSLRIPRSSGHPFHEHLATDSTVIRPPIPRASGH